MLNSSSKIKDVWLNPVGHDVLQKLLMQLGKSESLLLNPMIANMSLSTAAKLSKPILGEGFIDSLLALLNIEQAMPSALSCKVKPKWWKEAVFYQIYPRSFCDANDDGIGDLIGIIEKLPYLKELGVDVLWLSPIYDSPNDDMGYDIRDYHKIMQEFGTMEDFDALLAQVHQNGMRLIMDLVVNHTSDEHEWFKKALSDKTSPEHGYYHWRSEKNNWTSAFGGSAWNEYEGCKEYALHTFSKKQIDLNWDNYALRNKVYEMINRWLEKGIDGFRLDVINYISKAEGLPSGNEAIGKLMGYYGIEHYFYGPHLHEYLAEMRAETFANYNVVTIGETPGTGLMMSKLLTGEERKELDMVFNFDVLETPGKTRFDDYRYDLRYLTKYYTQWQQEYGNNCWMSLFFENHDNPRFISKVTDNEQLYIPLAKLLATIQFTLKGTPFIYQGQELGMTNSVFESIEQLKDVESINLYNSLIEGGKSEAQAMAAVNACSRDHARTPMQWNREVNAGFTKGIPWLQVNESYIKINAADQLHDENSIFSYYKRLIAIRKIDNTLVYGEFKPVFKSHKNLFCYFRVSEGSRYYIECNMTDKTQSRPVMAEDELEYILGSYRELSTALRPYEANIYKVKNF